MNDTPTRCPLSWPMGWKRTEAAKRADPKFGKRVASQAGGYSMKRQLTVADALTRIDGEIGAFTPPGRNWRIDPSDVVVSTNLRLRIDGLPRSDQPEPADPGVAIYFTFDGKPRVLACDKWRRVADNIAAIASHLDAIRGIERWGVGEMARAFEGYAALPQPASTMDARQWWLVLGVPQDASLAFVRAAWLTKIAGAHPDRGGRTEDAAVINAAWEEAQRALTQ